MGVSLKVKFMKMPVFHDTENPSMEVTFVDYPNEGDFFKNYSLFSWLGGVREGLKPRFDKDFWQKKTNELFDKLGEFYKSQNGNTQGFLEKIDMDQMHLIVYPVEALVGFNYDLVQVMDDGSLDPFGCTYRDQFENDFLPVLEYAIKNDLPYVLFGFES